MTKRRQNITRAESERIAANGTVQQTSRFGKVVDRTKELASQNPGAKVTRTKEGRAAGKRGGDSHTKKSTSRPGGVGGDEWNRDEEGKFTGGKS